MDLEKAVVLFAKVFVIGLALVAAGVMSAYWWASVPPTRPKSVPADAVWIWAPAVGVPAPKRGKWVSCRMDARDGKRRCGMMDKNGRMLYEGVFLPNEGGTARDGTLEIDGGKTVWEQSVFVDGELVLMPHLKTGEVLIPAVKYEEGKRLLDSLHHSP